MSKIEKKKVTDFNKVPDGNLSKYIAFGVDRVTNESAWADMESLRGNTAFQEWQDKNPGKTYDDWIVLLQAPAQEAADGRQIKGGFNRVWKECDCIRKSSCRS